MKKIFFIAMSFVFIFELSAKPKLADYVEFFENGIPFNKKENIVLSTGEFEIKFKGLSQNDFISIFLSSKEIKLKTPVKSEDSQIFYPACSVARDQSEEKSILYYDSERIFNTFFGKNKIDQNGNCCLKIRGFRNKASNQKDDTKLFCCIFVDFNNNEIIEKNEIAKFVFVLKDSNKYGE